MLDQILGSKTALKLFLHLFHYGETYPRAISKDFNISVSQVQAQLDRFENAGILVSKMVGRTRLYLFNKKSAITKPFEEIVKITYETLSLDEKEKIFATRRRPRRKGKPVIKK